LEHVLADPPRVLIVAGDDAMLHHPALAQLTGVAQASLSANLLYCGGPTIPRALARLGEIRGALP
jgi:iron complex transport system substrate-binding protein